MSECIHCDGGMHVPWIKTKKQKQQNNNNNNKKTMGSQQHHDGKLKAGQHNKMCLTGWCQPWQFYGRKKEKRKWNTHTHTQTKNNNNKQTTTTAKTYMQKTEQQQEVNKMSAMAIFWQGKPKIITENNTTTGSEQNVRHGKLWRINTRSTTPPRTFPHYFPWNSYSLSHEPWLYHAFLWAPLIQAVILGLLP